MHTRNHRFAFTLIETLVAIAIIGILIGLLLAAVQQVRSANAANSCRNNLRQVAIALHHYHDVHRVLPSGTQPSSRPMPFTSWNTQLLPFIEQDNLWRLAQDSFARNRLFSSPEHDPIRTHVVPLFICPADGRTMSLAQPENISAAITDYLGVAGKSRSGGMLFYNSAVKFSEVTDGLSQTLLLGERPVSSDEHFGWWYGGVGVDFTGNLDHYLAMTQFNLTFRAPTCPRGPYTYSAGKNEDMCSTFHFWSHHSGGANFALGDGSVRFFPYSTDPVLMNALATRAGGEPGN